MRPLHIFLCYATIDKEAVRQLYHRLRTDGFAPWFDEEDLLVGQHRRSETEKAVRESDVVLVCLSKASVAGTGQLHRHIKQALDVAEEQPEGTIFVIPARLELCDIPDRLAQVKGIDLFEEGSYERLIKALRFRESTLAGDADSPLGDTPEEVTAHRLARGSRPASVELKEDEPAAPLINQPPPGTSPAVPAISRMPELTQRADPNEFAPETRQVLALIMKGGGIKGLAYVGALRELEKHYQFNWFVGTSAGAITAVLLAAGYSTDELGQILGETNFREFLDAPFYKFPTNLYFYGGVYPGRKITKWLNDLLVIKLGRSNPSLEEAALGHVNAVNRVTIYASRRDQDALEFDSADPKWQDMPAAYAVRCSMAIPYVFQPPSHHGSDVFDGGTQNNYPVGVFLRRHPSSEFVGLYLKPEKARSEKPPSKLSQLISIWTEAADKRALQDHITDTVVIDPSPVKTLQFGLSAEEKDFLLKAGRAAALEFLHRKQVPAAPSLAEVEAAAREATAARADVLARRSRRRIVVRAGLSAVVIISGLLMWLWWSGQAATFLSRLRVNPSNADMAGKNNNQGNVSAVNTRVSPDAIDGPPPIEHGDVTNKRLDDVFLHLDKWTKPPTGWSLNSAKDRLVIENQPQLGCATDIVYDDFRLTFNLRLHSDGGAAWALRADQSGRNYYLFYLAGPTGRYPNKFVACLVRNGEIIPTSEITSDIDVKKGMEYHVIVTAAGNKFTHEIEAIQDDSEKDDLVPQPEFVDEKNILPRGRVCFRTIGDEVFSVSEVNGEPQPASPTR